MNAIARAFELVIADQREADPEMSPSDAIETALEFNSQYGTEIDDSELAAAYDLVIELDEAGAIFDALNALYPE